MRALLSGLAAAGAAMGMAAPATAGTPRDAFVELPNATVGLSGQAPSASSGGVLVGLGSGSGDHRFDRHRRRGDVDVSHGIWVNGGEWARHNNQSFKSDSYNDWWHDQPWRSQPAWVRNNQACRTYWSGGGWRC